MDEKASLTPGQTAAAVYAGRFKALGQALAERSWHDEAGVQSNNAGAGGTEGSAAVRRRSDAVDDLIRTVWAEICGDEVSDAAGDPAVPALSVAIVAVGGYGRRELFPYSDVDLLFLLDSGMPEKLAAEPLRRLNQALWDAGLRVSASTRSLAECERFDAHNVEAVTALLDARPLAGDLAMARQLKDHTVPGLVARDGRRIAARLLELTEARHRRFGNTLFHLEPNIKECPGGLRDAHLCAWLAQLGGHGLDAQTTLVAEADGPEFESARGFLTQIRTFLHLRHRRDDNVLDWQSQDEAARLAGQMRGQAADTALWMRLYFRHARVIARHTAQAIEDALHARQTPRGAARQAAKRPPASADAVAVEIEIRHGDLLFKSRRGAEERLPARVSADLALEALMQMAQTGARLPPASEERLADALPALAAQLEDGPELRLAFESILTGPHAGQALRTMHALGMLELFVPEFHGIDALVVRDAYHRYTVDEHTFVVIDTLNALLSEGSESDAARADAARALPHAARFGDLLRELPQRGLLLMAALLHDTGKGYAATEGTVHALESARLAERVLKRLEYDGREAGLVLDLIRNQREMSAALRRDVFDQENVKAFAALVRTPVALRMLALLTYADISAVHPGALTTWKAEKLWLLYRGCAAWMSGEGDAMPDAGPAEKLLEIRALLHGDSAERAALDSFLEGLPRRYLETRTPEQVAAHFCMSESLNLTRITVAQAGEKLQPAEVALTYAADASEITLVAEDRPLLFALLAGALAAWGMNILSAEAFSNAQGLAVDSVRFTDTYRTLELNALERGRFIASVTDVLRGETEVAALLQGRRRQSVQPPKRVVEARVDVDEQGSSQATIVEVIAQDTPGLLHALALTLAAEDLNIEVALVDTEGEMAIDVFYLTRMGRKLRADETESLRAALLGAIAAHSGQGMVALDVRVPS